MLHYKDVNDAQALCECLSSPTRVEILKLILDNRAESLDALAKSLHLSNGAITQHVKKLSEMGLVKLIETNGKHGIAKQCVVAVDRIIIDVSPELESRGAHTFNVPLGTFCHAQIKPYCAIATTANWIGERDDPRYFTYPERSNAAFIYFNSGKLGWTLPSNTKKEKPSEILLSLEISSKPYGHGRKRESDVDFFINDIRLGSYTVDGEFSDRRGLYSSPLFDDVCSYGKYRTIKIDRTATYVDGIKIGNHTVDEFVNDQLTFYISTENGIALFGNGFGDYDCGIRYTAITK